MVPDKPDVLLSCINTTIVKTTHTMTNTIMRKIRIVSAHDIPNIKKLLPTALIDVLKHSYR
jgi:hypothetical protein